MDIVHRNAGEIMVMHYPYFCVIVHIYIPHIGEYYLCELIHTEYKHSY